MSILHWSIAKQGPLTCFLLFLPKPCFWRFNSSPGIARGTQLYLGALDRLWGCEDSNGLLGRVKNHDSRFSLEIITNHCGYLAAVKLLPRDSNCT